MLHCYRVIRRAVIWFVYVYIYIFHFRPSMRGRLDLVGLLPIVALYNVFINFSPRILLILIIYVLVPITTLYRLT